MLIFETKLKFTQYFLSALGCFYIIPISFFTLFSNDFGLNILGIIILIIGIVQFSYTLKSFHLYDNCLIVRRPMFFINPNTKFDKNEIDRIVFRQVRTKIGGGNYLIVFGNKMQKNYMLTYSGATLKEFISKLKEAGIKTVQEFNIK